MVLGLMAAFKARNTSPEMSLYSALGTRWEGAVSSFSSKSTLPLCERQMKGFVCNSFLSFIIYFHNVCRRMI